MYRIILLLFAVQTLFIFAFAQEVSTTPEPKFKHGIGINFLMDTPDPITVRLNSSTSYQIIESYKFIPELNYQLMNKRQHIHRFGLRVNSIGKRWAVQYENDVMMADSMISSYHLNRVSVSCDYEYLLRFMRKSDFFMKPYLGFGGSLTVNDVTSLPGTPMSTFFVYSTTQAQLAYRMIPGVRAEFKKGYFVDLGLVLNLVDASYGTGHLMDPTLPREQRTVDTMDFNMPLTTPERLFGARLGLGVWL